MLGSRTVVRLVVAAVLGALALPVASATAHNSRGPGSLHGPFDHGGAVTWPNFRFDLGRTGFNPFERILSPATVGHLKLAWRFNTLRTADSVPAIVGGIAYFGSDSGYLFAVNARTGAPLWSQPNGTYDNTSPAISGDVVYMVGTNMLRARNRFTGALLWASPMPKGPFSLSSPVVVTPHQGWWRHGPQPHGVVYIGGDDGLYAFDAQTGTQLWKFATPAGVGSSPAVDHGLVFASTGATVYAIDATTHLAKWSFVTGGTTFLAQGSVAVKHGLVYVAVGGQQLRALDEQTGAVVWSVSNPGFRFSSPAVANGIVYEGSTDHSLYAFDARTGAPKWSFATGTNIAFNSPTVANGVVYVGSYDDNIYALNALTGAKLWSFATGGILEGSPIVVNGTLYFGSNDYFMYAFSLDGHAPAPAQAAGCQIQNGLYLPPQGLVPGVCHFAFAPGATYSGEGSFKITCSNGATFTAVGYNLPLTGCAGTVSILATNPVTGSAGGPGGGTVVGGNISPDEVPGACDATCLVRTRARVTAGLATNPPFGVLPPPLPY